MADEIKTEGGYQMELSRAATKMVEALASGNEALIKEAMSDHAAALGSQATTAMAAIAVTIIEEMGRQRTLLDVLSGHIQGENQRVLLWRGELREHIDDRFDNFGGELDGLRQESRAAWEATGDDLKKLSSASEELRIGQARLSGLVASLGENQDELSNRVDKVEHRLERVEHGVVGLDKRVGVLERAIRTISPQIAAMDESLRLMRQVLEANPPPTPIARLMSDQDAE